MRALLRLYIYLLLLAGVSFFSEASAETVKYYGLDFHVDESVSIDEQSTKITVFGKSQIIPPSEAVSYVVGQYISEKMFFDRFKPDQVEEFIKQAISEQDQQTTVSALRGYLLEKSIPREQRLKFLLSLGSSPFIQNVYKELLAEKTFLQSTSITHHLIAIVGVNDLAWVRQNVPLEVFSNRKKFLNHIGWMIVEKGEKGITDRFSPQLIRLCQSLFGPTDQSVQDLSILVDKLQGLLDLELSVDRTVLYPYLGKNLKSQELKVLRPLVIKKIHEFSDYAIEKGKAPSGLILLTELEPEERSEKTQALIAKALRLVTPPATEVRSNRAVRDLLEDESANNPDIREAYSSYLRTEFNELVERGQLRTAAGLREQLREINKQDQDGYDRMLYEEAIEWIREGRTGVGEKLLNLRSEAPGYFQKLELFFAGFYGSPFTLLLWSLIPILFVSLIVIRIWERSRPVEEEVEQFANNISEEEEWEDPEEYHKGLGVHYSGLRGRTSPELREYRELMAKLGLSQDAGLSELKSVYRKLIKEVHPDAQEESTAEASDEFLTLSRAYERIMELRKSLGLRD